jgi:hypothetical protein
VPPLLPLLPPPPLATATRDLCALAATVLGASALEDAEAEPRRRITGDAALSAPPADAALNGLLNAEAPSERDSATGASSSAAVASMRKASAEIRAQLPSLLHAAASAAELSNHTIDSGVQTTILLVQLVPIPFFSFPSVAFRSTWSGGFDAASALVLIDREDESCIAACTKKSLSASDALAVALPCIPRSISASMRPTHRAWRCISASNLASYAAKTSRDTPPKRPINFWFVLFFYFNWVFDACICYLQTRWRILDQIFGGE